MLMRPPVSDAPGRAHAASISAAKIRTCFNSAPSKRNAAPTTIPRTNETRDTARLRCESYLDTPRAHSKFVYGSRSAVGAPATKLVTLALSCQRLYRQATPKQARLARFGAPSGNIEFAGDDDPHLPTPRLQCLARARARRARCRVHCRRLAVFTVLGGDRRADVLCQRIWLSPLRLPCRAVAFSLCAQIAAPAALRPSRRAGAARSSVPAAVVSRAQSRGDGARLCAHLRLGSGRLGDVWRDARHLPL
jgi:hypothetical protein